MRIGNADREAAIESLHAAAELGKLTPEELMQRIDAAGSAKTRGDLDAVLADLAPPPAAPAMQRYQSGTPLPAPGASQDDPLVINATLSDNKRKGPWVIPRYVSVTAVAATVKLDCLEATTAEPIVEMQVSGGLGTVVLVVPEGWGVNLDRLTKGAGEVKSSVPAAPEWGHPQIVVSGGLGLGTFKARHANWLEKRRLEDD